MCDKGKLERTDQPSRSCLSRGNLSRCTPTRRQTCERVEHLLFHKCICCTPYWILRRQRPLHGPGPPHPSIAFSSCGSLHLSPSFYLSFPCGVPTSGSSRRAANCNKHGIASGFGGWSRTRDEGVLREDRETHGDDTGDGGRRARELTGEMSLWMDKAVLGDNAQKNASPRIHEPTEQKLGDELCDRGVCTLGCAWTLAINTVHWDSFVPRQKLGQKCTWHDCSAPQKPAPGKSTRRHRSSDGLAPARCSVTLIGSAIFWASGNNASATDLPASFKDLRRANA